ncbi:MAG: SCP2 sterol-binding domain-containing protein [Pseudomonadota bacterium]
MSDPTIRQIIQGMPSRFNADAAGKLDCVLQFDLSGEQGGHYFATIKEGTCHLDEGTHEAPTLRLIMSDQTYIDMVMGRITGQQAFFKRKLRYVGPINLAIKLHTLFTR